MTDSYTDKIGRYSKYYRTFSNVVTFRSVCQGGSAEKTKKSGCVQIAADKAVDFVAHGFPAGDRHAGGVGHRLSFHRSSKFAQRGRQNGGHVG